MPDPNDDFLLLSSARYDPALLHVDWNTHANGGIKSPYLLLPYHFDRLQHAVREHGWQMSPQLTISSIKSACDAAVKHASIDPASQDIPLKIRITLSRDGRLEAHASATSVLPHADITAASIGNAVEFKEQCADVKFGPILDIHPDDCNTPSSLFTRTKTTHRPAYSAARARMGIPPLPAPSNSDVLLFNEAGELTETSIRNIAFLRGEPPHWVTPRTETGCLPGVMRRFLIEKGRIVPSNEGELSRKDLIEGEYVLTFNGVEGCRVGRIVSRGSGSCPT